MNYYAVSLFPMILARFTPSRGFSAVSAEKMRAGDRVRIQNAAFPANLQTPSKCQRYALLPPFRTVQVSVERFKRELPKEHNPKTHCPSILPEVRNGAFGNTILGTGKSQFPASARAHGNITKHRKTRFPAFRKHPKS